MQIIFGLYLCIRMKQSIFSNRKSTVIFALLFSLILGACTTTHTVVTSQRSGSNHRSNKTITHRVQKNGRLTSTQKKIVNEAMTWLGTPYAYAKAEKGEGTDCSGLVMMVYVKSLNYKIPRNSARQADFCEEVKPDKVKAGDLVFFATGKNPERVSHVGIMLDSEEFIHCSSSKGVVVTSIAAPYYAQRLLKIGRLPMLNAYK